jgi:hypothetical protein
MKLVLARTGEDPGVTAVEGEDRIMVAEADIKTGTSLPFVKFQSFSAGPHR